MTNALQPYTHGPAVRRYRRRLLLRVAFSDPILAMPTFALWTQLVLSVFA